MYHFCSHLCKAVRLPSREETLMGPQFGECLHETVTNTKNLFRKLKTHLPDCHLLVVYHTLFHAHIRYGVLFLGTLIGCSSAAEEGCASDGQWWTERPLSPFFHPTANTDCFQTLCFRKPNICEDQTELLLHHAKHGHIEPKFPQTLWKT